MAKNKNKENREQQAQKIVTDNGTDFSIKDYLIINGVFWVFLGVVALIVFITAGGKRDPIMDNVFSFIFLVFGCGFTAVSAFDYIYERVAKKNENKQ